jgi:hypothetical protein
MISAHHIMPHIKFYIDFILGAYMAVINTAM